MRPENLVLLRHGESEWNQQDRFAGWADVTLTARGEDQARRAGELLRDSGVRPDTMHTSLLRRASATAELVRSAFAPGEIPIRASWRLNERHYGALQGRTRTSVLEELGAPEFRRIRRSLHGQPPPSVGESPFRPGDDPALNHPVVPRSESLQDVRARLLPYWDDVIAPDLRDRKTVLVVAHGNTIRVIRWYLEVLSEAEVGAVRIPLGLPLMCRIDPDGPASLTSRVLGAPETSH